MSFPNIPDIDPYINISFEDAINLLLTSIAMEEVSISKLMDAETSKILYVLDNGIHHDCKYGDCGNDACGHKDGMFHDVLEINKSVDDTIKNMIKLQMLLQFKLDNIKGILPFTSSTTTTSTSTSTTTTCTRTTTTKTASSTTTTTHTTTCTTSTFSTTTKKECSCCLTGIGKGYLPDGCDEFYRDMASLNAFVYSSDVKNRSIRYFVRNGDANLHMRAWGYNVKIYPIQCTDQLVVYGKGNAEKHFRDNSDICGCVEFVVTVCKKVQNNLEYRVEIKSEANPKLNHDSGFIQIQNSISDLWLAIFC